MSDPFRLRLRAGALSALVVAVAGCAVGPNYKPPVIETDAAFAGQGLIDAKVSAPAEEWWKGFGDPLLDELVTESLASNRSIAAIPNPLRPNKPIRPEVSRCESTMSFAKRPTMKRKRTWKRSFGSSS